MRETCATRCAAQEHWTAIIEVLRDVRLTETLLMTTRSICTITGSHLPGLSQPRCVEDVLGDAAALLQAAVRLHEGERFAATPGDTLATLC